MASTKKPIIVRTYVGGGPRSGGVLVSERVLRPLTTAERESGLRDELAEHVAKFGRVSAPRGRGRVRDYDCDEPDEIERPHKLPPKSRQLKIWNAMACYYRTIAHIMAQEGTISASDVEGVAFDMHEYVCAKVAERFDPSRKNEDVTDKEALERFCKRQARDWRIYEIRKGAAIKRGYGLQRVSFVTGLGGAEDEGENRGEISEEIVPSVRDWEAALSWRDLMDFLATVLTVRERVSLRDLLSGETQEGVAEKLGLTLASWRRHVLAPLQLWVDYLIPADAHRHSMPEYGPRRFILN